MAIAQHLYETFGFEQCGELQRGGIEFLIYERACS